MLITNSSKISLAGELAVTFTLVGSKVFISTKDDSLCSALNGDSKSARTDLSRNELTSVVASDSVSTAGDLGVAGNGHSNAASSTSGVTCFLNGSSMTSSVCGTFEITSIALDSFVSTAGA